MALMSVIAVEIGLKFETCFTLLGHVCPKKY